MKKLILPIICIFILSSCADYQKISTVKQKERKYYSSKGFALIYSDDLFEQKIVNKKIKNESLVVLHNSLKVNTSIIITNPKNSKNIETKIFKKADYPKIFNLVVSQKVANLLGLDIDNPYIEFNEIKKNKTFVAKEANIFDEEKNVAQKAPVEEIKMDDLTDNQTKKKKKVINKYGYSILINDFYYESSAIKLKNKIVERTKLNIFFVKKINDKKYRLLAGPFKNFNALKTTYISLNNLGFDDLNIYKN